MLPIANTYTHTHTRHTHKNTDNDFSTLYIISKVKKMLHVVSENCTSWCLVWVWLRRLLVRLFSLLLHLGLIYISCVTLSGHLLFVAVWRFARFVCSLSPTLASTDKQRSVSLHSQVYEAGLQIVALSCQEDFFLGIVEFDLFPYGTKDSEVVSVQLSPLLFSLHALTSCQVWLI